MASLRNAEEDELDPQYDNKQLADVLADEPTVDAPQDEDEEHRRIRRAKNAKRAQRRRNTQNRARIPRDVNNAFAAVAGHEYRTPIGVIAEATLLAQQLSPNPQIQRLQYLTQRTLVQLDGQHPVSPTRNQPLRSERHGDTALVSRTPRGGHRSWRNDNRQRNEGHPSARGNNK
jgi:signal transduction histidine kinase